MAGSVKSVIRENGFEVMPETGRTVELVRGNSPHRLVRVRGQLPDGRWLTVLGHCERDAINRLLFLRGSQSCPA